jgi:hypothetical protein
MSWREQALNSAGTQLRPYVSKAAKIDPKDSLWPMANTKGVNASSKRGGIYGPNGFDGAYYIQLAEFLAEQEKQA